MEALSVKVVEIEEVINDSICKDNSYCSHVISPVVSPVHNTSLENQFVRLDVNLKTGMIDGIHFKELNQYISINMQVMRFKGASFSESGAYIFAPSAEAVPMLLKPIGLYVINGSIQS
jgi:hypothetical protein